jgi:outer membrane receptor for ferrienterochelin and colicins
LKKLLFLLCLIASTKTLLAQNPTIVKVLNKEDNAVLSNVSISINNKNVGITNKSGLATINLSGSTATIQFTRVDFENTSSTITLPYNDTLVILLVPSKKILDEVIVVSSTRNNQRIENSPLKVEVLGLEEMQEESVIKPAGIASILGDISGVQIQQSSQVTANANVRIQGLDGRYTQILKDGLPLYDGFSGGFGILSIPPLDLKQVELIKGSASTLYGGGAIGGLINIISRKPTTKQEAVVSVNKTTLKETNFNSYFSKRYKKVGYTLFVGYNFQKAVDVNKDTFSDVPNLKGTVLHPRLFLYPNKNLTITLGYTGTFEKRNGGDMLALSGKTNPQHQYFENNSINRNSYELVAQQNLPNKKKLEFKNSISTFSRRIFSNSISFKGYQQNYYSEASIFAPYKNSSLVAGINATGDKFTNVTNNIPLQNFSNNTIGAFVQNTWTIKEKTTIETGLRNDYHFTYGNFILPRVAIFHRFDKHWATRAGVGFGYKTPNALAPQNTDYSIQDILPLPNNITAEKSTGYNAEVNYKTNFGDEGKLFINHAFFLTQLNNPVVGKELSNGNVVFANESKPIITKGYDTYIKAVIDKWEIYAGYTLTIAERKYLAANQFVLLTPKHRFAFTLVRDFEEEGFRIGLEGSYTGAQHRTDFTKTPAYFFMAGMVEKKIGKHFSAVLNAENILDYRQSKIETLLTGSTANPSFKPLWAPIEGRVINVSLKYTL